MNKFIMSNTKVYFLNIAFKCCFELLAIINNKETNINVVLFQFFGIYFNKLCIAF